MRPIRKGENIPENTNSDTTSSGVFFFLPGVPGASVSLSPLRISRFSPLRIAFVAALPSGGTPGQYPRVDKSQPNVAGAVWQS